MADDLKSRVESVLRAEVAPALQLDGSTLDVLDVSGGVVHLRLGAACAGCPATLMTLIHGLEAELRNRFPEIDHLEAVP